MITDRRKALLHLAHLQQGDWADAQAQIAPELLQQFYVLGFIRHEEDKWQITAIGIKQSLFYRDPTPEEAEQGRQMYKLDLR
ncbi:MAG: hypothetical protein IJS88_04205 [Alphaproteobacteria bacterium]|nr:hypothetical protein [Alphaproteobacteria bacterium]